MAFTAFYGPGVADQRPPSDPINVYGAGKDRQRVIRIAKDCLLSLWFGPHSDMSKLCKLSLGERHLLSVCFSTVKPLNL